MGVSEEPDKTLTRQGFTKGQFLTDANLDGILERLAAGDTPGRACRTQGTSFTQFIRRVQKDPDLESRYRKAEAEGRQATDLSSET
jgi:hypothetical protein